MSFCTERTIKAVKRKHRCRSCFKEIPIGSSSLYSVGKGYGDFWYGHFHTDCRKAELAINDKFNKFRSCEWWSLDEALSDPEGRERYWLKEKFPEVFQRFYPNSESKEKSCD